MIHSIWWYTKDHIRATLFSRDSEHELAYSAENLLCLYVSSLAQCDILTHRSSSHAFRGWLQLQLCTWWIYILKTS